MKTEDLEPLGGLYEGRLWPLTELDFAAIEKITGWELPDDYKLFVATWGASRPSVGYWMIDFDADNTTIAMFMGNPAERSASVVQMAGDYLDPLRLIVIAHADNGLFFMAPSGEVFFERRGDPTLHRVGTSFEEFFDRIRFHGEEL